MQDRGNLPLRFQPAYLARAALKPDILHARGVARSKLKLFTGSKVLDLACGLGEEVREISALVGDRGHVLGIDADPDLVRRADLRKGVIENIEYRVGNAAQLEIPDASFDSCRCERLLQHLDRAEGRNVFMEACRILKPGGQLVFVDTDWTSLSIHCPDPLIERSFCNAVIARTKNPYAARAMRELFHLGHIANVEVSIFPIQLTAKDVRANFLALFPSLSDRTQHATFGAWLDRISYLESTASSYAYVNMVVCSGSK